MTEKNTYTVQNVIDNISPLSNAFKEINSASTQIDIMNVGNNISNLLTISNTAAFRNIATSTAAFSKAFKEANMAFPKINMMDMGKNISNLSTISNTDALRNMTASTAAFSKAFKEANVAFPKINMMDMGKNISNLSTISNTDALRNMTASTAAFSNAFKAIRVLDNYSEIISKIDWQDLNPTEIDVQQAYEISEDEHVEENMSKELNNNKSRKEIIARLWSVLVIIFLIIGYLSDLIAVIEYTEYTIYPAIQSLSNHVFDSDKAAIKWLNNELKQDVSVQITNNFRIVTKDDLAVREGKKAASRIKGKLNSKDVVQIIEKKRNWTYISYSNHEESEYVEGWVFTRYLKQIK